MTKPVVYVGSSWNLHERLKAHRKNGWIKFETVVKVRVTVKYGDWLMHEHRLINRLKPINNQKSTYRNQGDKQAQANIQRKLQERQQRDAWKAKNQQRKFEALEDIRRIRKEEDEQRRLELVETHKVAKARGITANQLVAQQKSKWSMEQIRRNRLGLPELPAFEQWAREE